MILVLVEVEKNTNNVMEKMPRLAKKSLSMKSFSLFKYGIVVLVVIFAGSCCKKGSATEPTFPIYSYTSAIVNPPSHFQVNYIVTSPGDRIASITFENNSVWIIEKLGDSRVLFSARNDTEVITITARDTIAFQKDYEYLFSANNFNMLEITNYLVDFIETDLDYGTFEPKL